jgi:predicted RecB family nuclease
MISNEVFVASRTCRRKAYFKQASQSREVAESERVHLDLDKTYRQTALAWFLGEHSPGEMLRDPPTLEAAIRSRARFIVGATAQSGKVCSRLELLERVDAGQENAARYAPVLFVSNNKVTKNDRRLLAFQALALSLVQGAVPEIGKIVSGGEPRVVRVRCAPRVEEARRLVAVIEADARGETPPTLTLNRHCAACAFRKGCQVAAEQTDDLRLLRTLSEKEINKLRARGVTPLTQFSSTYRAGRRGQRRPEKARQHDPALQALALREQKVYVMDAPDLKPAPVALYLDLEGVPDLDFGYLIGLLVVEGQRSTFHSFWANEPGQEKDIWNACLGIIASFPAYALYHYGQYETRFLKRMKKLSGADGAARTECVLARSCNVLSAIHSHVYFPTRSNGLKEVAGLRGFKWTAGGASGIQALAWRLAWETGREGPLKQNLLLYNPEDCLALKLVAEFILSLCAGAPTGPTIACELPVAQADDLKRPGTFRSGKTKFFCPELEHINKCAYSDYQRERIYVRTNPAVRKSLKRRTAKKKLKVNQEIECGRPEKGPEGSNERVRDLGRQPYHKLLLDLKSTPSGVKRWVVRYSSQRYQCSGCKVTFHADIYRARKSQFGRNRSAWAIYHHVALRQTYDDITEELNDLFNFSFTYEVLKRIKPDMAERYRPTYEKLKEKLRRGPLAHADETKAQVKGHAGYVWAFTNLEEVIYVYTPTRDGDILGKVLDGFTGVLVSDFDAAYDGVKCPQQKCLIHFMRDINDDLFHNPFDEELKQVAQQFVAVLKPIIDTMDKHGLKRHFLHRHKKEVEGFVGYLAAQQFQSERARHYQKRVDQYKEKLFIFLDHDGVPWNNNNAELAVKRFASRRKLMGASFTEKGIQDYLVFLSIYQTCRNKNVSFLRFLLSGKFDLDAFVEGVAGESRTIAAKTSRSDSVSGA